MALALCQECGTELSIVAVVCPRCGAPRPTAPPTAAERRPMEKGPSPFRKPPVPAPPTARPSPAALSHPEQTRVGETSLTGSRRGTENATDHDRRRRRLLWGLGGVLLVLVLAAIGGARLFLALLAFVALIALGVAVTALIKGSLPTLRLTKRIHAVGLLVVAFALMGIIGSLLPRLPEEEKRSAEPWSNEVCRSALREMEAKSRPGADLIEYTLSQYRQKIERGEHPPFDPLVECILRFR